MEIVVPSEFQRLYRTDVAHPILKIPHEALRATAEPVTKLGRKIDLLADYMIRTMKAANGIGLAAPQIGVLKRIIVVAPEGARPTALINPKIIETEGEIEGEEGCLSIPGLYGMVKRPVSVTVEAQDRKGRVYKYELNGMPSRVVQHEIDHLDGILFIDRVDPATLHWQEPAKASSVAD